MKEKKFYQNVHLYLGLGLIMVFWGFSQSYFNRLGQTSLPYHIHGISASLWMVLLIVQPYLYSKGNLRAHRILGWSSLIIVTILVLGGLEMMHLMIQHQEKYPPGIVYKLAFIDVVTLLAFVILYVLAIYYRKKLKLHARFMVCTIFGPLNPALTRIFFSVDLAKNFNEALTYSYILIELVLLLIIWRERNSKEMKLTYLPVLLFTVVQHLLMYSVENWAWWKILVNYLAG